MSLERLKLGISNWVCKLTMMSISVCMIDFPQTVVYGFVTSLNLGMTDNISEKVQ